MPEIETTKRRAAYMLPGGQRRGGSLEALSHTKYLRHSFFWGGGGRGGEGMIPPNEATHRGTERGNKRGVDRVVDGEKPLKHGPGQAFAFSEPSHARFSQG